MRFRYAAAVFLAATAAAFPIGAVEVSFVTKLLAPDGTADDRFGYVHSIDGDRLAVAALGDDDAGINAGSVSLFERHQGGIDAWGAVAKVYASDAADYDVFGQSLSLRGDSLVVGRFNTEIPKPGAAYVFALRGDPAGWAEVALLQPADSTVNDFFGRFVATDGATTFIGAFGEDSIANGSGAVYQFESDRLDPTLWAEVDKLKVPDPQANDYFGRRFGFDGGSLVVAAFYDDDNGTDAGAAYAFEASLLDPARWRLDTKILADDGMARDHFGRHTTVDGDIAAIGAWRHDGGDLDAGATYLFRRFAPGQPAWQQIAKLLPADLAADDRFGIGLALDRDILAVGAPFHDASGADAGAVYLFARHAGGRDAWGQVAKLTAPDAAPDDLFGYWLSAHNKTLIVGARQDDNENGIDAGAVYIYELAQPETDLAVTPRYFGRPIQPGVPMVLPVSVRNGGPEMAPETLVGGQLFGGARITVARSSSGVCAIDQPRALTYTCDLGDIPPGSTAIIVLVVVPQTAVPILHAADAGAMIADPARGNNTGQLLIR